jgi:hypothetical protein
VKVQVSVEIKVQVKVTVKFTLEQAIKDYRVSGGTAVLFFNLGARCRWWGGKITTRLGRFSLGKKIRLKNEILSVLEM